MNLVIEKIGREDNNEDDIIENFSYEFFEEDMFNSEVQNSIINSNSIPHDKINNNDNQNNNITNKPIINSKQENNKELNKNKEKDKNKNVKQEMIIDFDEENLERKESNKNNYSLDQEDIIEILNLNKNNKNDENLEKDLFDKLNAKILLKDLNEKKKQFKDAYIEYSSKLKETMNNDYLKNIMENPSKKKSKNKIKNDFLIHQQTNTINDINIFCLNNKEDNNNFINLNKQENKIFRNDNNIINDNGSKINIINFESMKNSDYIKELKLFLIEYNNSIQKRTYMDMKKNPNLNYELYIDVLNDLNYIDINISPQIYFLNNSLYKSVWNFLTTIHNKNNNNAKEIINLESNSLLIFLLILNEFFNSIKKLIEIKSELNWLKIENYEILIINDKYIEKNFGILKEIRSKNKSNLIGSDINKFDSNLNILDKKIKSIEISNYQDDIISDYLKSYAYNNEVNNNISQQNQENKKTRNYSETKLNRRKKYIKDDDNNNKQKQLYAFKPKIKNISFNIEKTILKERKQSYKNIRINKYSGNTSINNIDLRKSLHKSGSKKKIKSKINYIDFVNLSQNDINNKNNKSFVNYNHNNNKRNENSNSKLKRKYYNKIKQNRTDLLKLFKNNKYKEGTINEKYEEIKRQRESNSKSKVTKVKINYENVINIDNNDNNIKNETNQKQHKYQFKKKENT